MADFRVQVQQSNYDSAVRGISRLENRLKKEAGTDMARRAEAWADRLIYDTPPSPNYVRTGNLRRSIGSEEVGDVVEVYAEAEYAEYVHEGTRHMAPRPFLARAAADEEERLGFIARRIAKEEGLR